MVSQFRVAVQNADWQSMLSFIRFSLLQWSVVLPDVTFPRQIIDSLSLD
jgi:hypothetical protein